MMTVAWERNLPVIQRDPWLSHCRSTSDLKPMRLWQVLHDKVKTTIKAGCSDMHLLSHQGALMHSLEPRECQLVTSSTSLRLLLVLLDLLHLTSQGISLGLDSLLSSLAGGLGLVTHGVHLVLQGLVTLLLGLRSVYLYARRLDCSWKVVVECFTYMLNQGTLVLECVTLA